jgi:putative membrane protein
MAKVLVLCVDRDDDMGRKAHIKGPIIGRERNIKAAEALIMADPAESDANAIFEAIRIADSLKDAVDVVTLTGHQSRGYQADKTVIQQLDEVLPRYGKIDGVYLVTDGADDEEIIPLLQSRTKIVSKKTLIIRQAKELEKSYYVIKEVLRDPAFARLIFGLPGIVLLTIAFFQEMGLKIVVLAIGLYLLFKGFGLEEPVVMAARGFRETTSIERASFPLYIGAFVMALLSLWTGYERFATIVEPSILKQTAAFIAGWVNLFIVAVILFLIGRIGDMHYRGEPMRIRRYGMSIVTTSALWLVAVKATSLIFGEILIDEFIGWVVLAFIGSIVGLAIVRRVYVRRYIVSRLAKDQEVYDIDGNFLGKVADVSRKDAAMHISTGKAGKKRIQFNRIVLVKDFVAVRPG